MIGRIALCLVAAVVVLSAFGPRMAEAQSLAEVARKEAERRRATESQPPAKVLTNADLTPDFTVPPPNPEPVSGTNGNASEEVVPKDAVKDEAAAAPRPRTGKSEDWWRGRATALRNGIAAQQAQVADLQAGASALAGAEGPGAETERGLSRQALLKAHSDLAHFQKELVDFEADARARKIPPDWLR